MPIKDAFKGLKSGTGLGNARDLSSEGQDNRGQHSIQVRRNQAHYRMPMIQINYNYYPMFMTPALPGQVHYPISMVPPGRVPYPVPVPVVEPDQRHYYSKLHPDQVQHPNSVVRSDKKQHSMRLGTKPLVLPGQVHYSKPVVGPGQIRFPMPVPMVGPDQVHYPMPVVGLDQGHSSKPAVHSDQVQRPIRRVRFDEMQHPMPIKPLVLPGQVHHPKPVVGSGQPVRYPIPMVPPSRVPYPMPVPVPVVGPDYSKPVVHHNQVQRPILVLRSDEMQHPMSLEPLVLSGQVHFPQPVVGPGHNHYPMPVPTVPPGRVQYPMPAPVVGPDKVQYPMPVPVVGPDHYSQSVHPKQVQPPVPVLRSDEMQHSIPVVSSVTGAANTGIHFFPNAQKFNMPNAQFNVNQSGPSIGPLQSLAAKSVPSATYNSGRSSFDNPKCDEDTRVGLTEELMDWAQSDDMPSNHKLLCMTGSAGSGKSALAHTISTKCGRKKILGASFFFSVSDSPRNNSSRFVASLAFQISQSIKPVRRYILPAVERDPTIFDMSLETQTERLLINPILEALQSSWSPRHPWIIVVDGLDECRGEQQQAQVLRVLHACVQTGLPFRVFVTSRPEHAVRSALASTGHLSEAYHIILNERDATADIRLYLRRRLGRICNNHQLEILVERASGHFIYAATVVKFVTDRRRSASHSLQTVLDWVSTSRGERGRNPFAALDDLYTSILSAAQAAYQPSSTGELEGRCHSLIYRLISFLMMGDLRTIEGEMHIGSREIEHFFMWDDHECNRILDDLHSVIRVNNLDISFYHKSFLDYLLDSSRCQSFYVPPGELFADLASKSLDHVLSVDLNYFRAFQKMDFSGTANTSRNFSKDILTLALLAWPRLLPLALMIDPNMPIYNKICQAVTQLSKGQWANLVKLEALGFQKATSTIGLQLLSAGAGGHGKAHWILELCRSLPLPPMRVAGSAAMYPIVPISRLGTDVFVFPRLFVPFCDHFLQHQSAAQLR